MRPFVAQLDLADAPQSSPSVRHLSLRISLGRVRVRVRFGRVVESDAWQLTGVRGLLLRPGGGNIHRWVSVVAAKEMVGEAGGVLRACLLGGKLLAKPGI